MLVAATISNNRCAVIPFICTASTGKLIDITRYPFPLHRVLSYRTLQDLGQDRFGRVYDYRGNIAMNTGTNTIATVLSSLITVLSAGPAVSLYGSPIRSPTTAIA